MLVVLNELRDQNLMFIVYKAQGRDLAPIGTSCSIFFMGDTDLKLSAGGNDFTRLRTVIELCHPGGYWQNKGVSSCLEPDSFLLDFI